MKSILEKGLKDDKINVVIYSKNMIKRKRKRIMGKVCFHFYIYFNFTQFHLYLKGRNFHKIIKLIPRKNPKLSQQKKSINNNKLLLLGVPKMGLVMN